MKIDITMTMEGALANWTKTNIRKVIQAALFKVGDYWHRNFMKKHFTKAGAREYGYAPRKGERARAGSKTFRKVAGPAERREGQILPLVHSGALRAACQTRQLIVEQTGGKIRVLVWLRKARALNLRPTNAKINMREEATTISEGEKRVLTNLLNREVIKGLRGLPMRRRRRKIS